MALFRMTFPALLRALLHLAPVLAGRGTEQNGTEQCLKVPITRNERGVTLRNRESSYGVGQNADGGGQNSGSVGTPTVV